MRALTALVLILGTAPPAFAEMPALPPGLGGQPELPSGLGGQPELPPGLGGQPELPPGLGGAPELPVGLDGADTSGQAAIEAEEPSALFTGFFDLRYGARTQDNALMPRDILGEGRLHLEAGFGTTIQTRLAFDVVGDVVLSGQSLDLNAGTGVLDLRQANVSFRPVASVDVKLGRQILTWGTGDLLFINDLFPKDYESFLVGRDIEYLKAPSDALKLSFFSDIVNLDLVYTAQFDPDRYIDGERLSFFSPIAGSQIGGTAIPVALPDDSFSDDELALRLYRTVAGFELAAYFYDGFWKSPVGYDTALSENTFPQLQAIGASLRGPVGPGLLNVELGYYDSNEDPTGSDPNIPNSQTRWLIGYEMEVARETTLGLQYYQEIRDDQAAYLAALPTGMTARPETRDVLTARLTRSFLDQRLIANLFVADSPSDKDGYVRASLSYSVSDALRLNVGINHFYGDTEQTFYGQFQDDSNAYVGLRFGF